MLQTKLLFVFGIIVLGYLLGRYLKFKTRWFSTIILNFLIPLVVFNSIMSLNLRQASLIPGIALLFNFSMSLVAIIIHSIWHRNTDKHFLQCIYGYFNIGWFGVPVIQALFGKEWVSIILGAYIGNSLFGNTYGYYLVARRKFHFRQALLKLLLAPPFLAYVFAFFYKVMRGSLPVGLESIFELLKWVLSFLGTLVIGIAVSGVNLREVNYKKYFVLLLPRFVTAPLVMSLLLITEHFLLGVLGSMEKKILFLSSVFPVAANLVVMDSAFGLETGETSIVVLCSTVFSLIIISVSVFWI